MTSTEAKLLEPGQRVSWDGNHDDLGTVTDKSVGGVHVKWDQGQKGWMDYRGMGFVQKAKS